MLSNFKGYTVTAPDGKEYEVNAPEGTSEDELYSYVQDTYYPTTATAGEVNKSMPVMGTGAGQGQATRTLEDVPGAYDDLNKAFFDGQTFTDTQKMFNEKYKDSGVQLGDEQAKLWADNKTFAQTPTGAEYFKAGNSPLMPVQKATGFEDPLTPDSGLEEFGAAATKSASNMANSAIGLSALGAELVGAEDTADSLLDTYLENQAAIQFNNPTAAKKIKDVRTLGEAGMVAANILGELAPQMASSLGFGLVGSIAGKQVAQRSVSGMVDDLVSKGMTQEVAEQMALKAVQKKAATGAIAATTAQSIGQSSGSIFGDTYGATGEKKAWTSLLAGTAAGSLDSILPAFVMKKLGVGGAIAETAIVNSLIKKVGKDAASAFLMEGGTEALQTIIEQLPAGKGINWDDVVEAGLRGGFGGSVVGAASGTYEGMKQNNSVTERELAKPKFEGEPIVVPTTRGKRSGKKYQEQLGVAQDGVIDRVTQLTANWENAPQFEVHKNFLNLQDAPNDVVGVYRDGKVYLNTENILAEAKRRDVSPEDIVSSVTYHEALGHYGLAQEFGDSLDGTLSTILANSKVYQKRVQDWMNDNPDAYKGNPNRDILALEEILAEKSENGRMPASIVNIFKNQIKDFGRKMGLNMQYSTREVETILGMAHAAVVEGKGRAGVRDNGYRTMYAGKKAAAAPQEEKRWFSGPDGKARFEFSDDEASLNESVLERTGDWTINLPAVLKHPELFEQYPSLKETVIKQKPLGYGVMGSYNPASNTISVSPSNPNKLSTILHEVQHNIQEIEDFARGGNQSMAVSAMTDEHVLDSAKNLLDYKDKKYQEKSLLIEAIQIAERMPEGRALIDAGNAVKDAYARQDKVSREIQETRRKFGFTQRLTEDELMERPEYAEVRAVTKKANDNVYDARQALRKILIPGDYFKTPKKDLEQWEQLAYVLEKGDAGIAKEQQLWHVDYNALTNLSKVVGDGDVAAVRDTLNRDNEVTFQAYESLLGEVEARDTQARQNMTMEERQETPAYTSQNEKVPPSAYVIAGVQNPKDSPEVERLREAYAEAVAKSEKADEAARKASQEFVEVEAEARKAGRSDAAGYLASPDGFRITLHPTYKAMREAGRDAIAAAQAKHKARNALDEAKGVFETAESRESPRDGSDLRPDILSDADRARQEYTARDRMEAEHQRDLDADKPEAANDRYMRMTSPDKVKFSPEEVAEMTPEELFDSENALNILKGMTEGYTPVVMNIEELEQEIIDRGLSPSKVMRKNGIGAGELVKRMFMYDIAMTKMNDRLSTLWEKMQNGTFTADDKAAYLRGVFKRDELAARIFEDQGELGRALAALKSIQYTKRRVQGMQETLAQFAPNSAFEALNDPEVFYKFAQSTQEQIDAIKAKAKEKGAEYLGNALNLPRALMSSMDFSAALRQGLFLIHKPAWWKAFPQMFRYAGSERAFNDLMEDITARDTYDQMVKSKLALSNMGSKLNSREEDFMSSWAERIIGVGRLVKASERAYVGFLNKVRADVFDDLLSKLPDDASDQDKKDIAAFVNAASGRGNLPGIMAQSAPLLNALFFSPRLMSSRIKMATVLVDPRTYISMNKVARNEYIKSLLAVGSLGLMITTLAILGGAEGEEDPRSSDFGKLKFGDTRYDIFGGQAQYFTLAARLALKSYKTADGDIKKYGSKFGQTTRLDAIDKFASNKAAPIPSFIMDYFRGVNAIGEKFEWDSAIMSRFIPLYLQDVSKGVNESKGLGEVAAKTIPGLFGIGTQTYTNPSLDTEKELDAPESFKMQDAADGEYKNATVKDGEVILDEKAQIEWASQINFYYKEWMKDEISSKEWKTLSDDEKKDIIKAVRKDAREEAKLNMLELLEIPEKEEEG